MCWSRPDVQVSTPQEPPSSPTPLKGVVIAVGRRAATVAQQNTQRQFYASFDTWGDHLRTGDVLHFRIDPLCVAGRHVVGKSTYDRHHCVPIDTAARKERDLDSHSV